MEQGAMKLLTKQLLKEGPGFVKMVPEEGELALSFLIMAPCSMIIGVGPAYCGHWASREPGELCFSCWSAAGAGAGPCRDGARARVSCSCSDLCKHWCWFVTYLLRMLCQLSLPVPAGGAALQPGMQLPSSAQAEAHQGRLGD